MSDRPKATGRESNSALMALRVLEEVSLRQPIGVSDLARALDLPKSTVQRALVTLEQAGWLCLSANGRRHWTLTAKPLMVGLRADVGQTLRDAAATPMERLRNVTGETVHLAVREGGSLVIVAHQDGTQAVRTFIETGARVPLHASAAGVAILAASAQADVDAVLRERLSAVTAGTPTGRAAVEAAIAAARERGYAVNDGGWWRPEVGAVAAAITGKSGVAAAALSLSVPLMRLTEPRVAELGPLVVAAAEEISANLRLL